ncbi:MAG TPA: CHAD domain-containing protein [Pyrinomonadaceae bacterium]|nr:CHAD domain-containing protein [Pyrinomonadaceae bacterium]
MSKANEIKELNCGADVTSGVKLVLRTRLAEMCALGNRATDWSNIEGVHDMRVASRRLRSAMKDFELFLRGKSGLRGMRAEVRKVADALGGVRDQDVAIAALEKLSEKAPADAREGLERIVAERNRNRDASREALGALITESNLAEMGARWNAALETLSRSSHRKGKFKHAENWRARLSFGDAGHIIITRRWNELDELSSSLFNPFKVKPLHDMRIAAKRLRYALELFSECPGGDALAPYAKDVADMQAALGELHDCDVWIKWLGGRLQAHASEDGSEETSAESPDVRKENRRTTVWLMRHFTDERTKQYRTALAHWNKWQLNGFGKNLRAHLDVESFSSKVGEQYFDAARVMS